MKVKFEIILPVGDLNYLLTKPGNSNITQILFQRGFENISLFLKDQIFDLPYLPSNKSDILVDINTFLEGIEPHSSIANFLENVSVFPVEDIVLHKDFITLRLNSNWNF